jgi:hypothetical protein
MHKVNKVTATKCGVLVAFIGIFWILEFVPPLRYREWTVASAQTRKAAQSSDDRFDELVRDDFFAGMLGDKTRLERGMKFCEDILARDPKHAEALVWHGGGLLSRAAIAYRSGDNKLGDALWTQGLREMNDAVSFEPDHIGVKIGRSATIVGLAQAGWDASDRASHDLLKSALLDYEKVYEVQKPTFSKLGTHSRGELLFGLASGWSILGENAKAAQYLKLVVENCKGTPYETEAKKWRDLKPQVIQHDCTGCHVSKSR